MPWTKKSVITGTYKSEDQSSVEVYMETAACYSTASNTFTRVLSFWKRIMLDITFFILCIVEIVWSFCITYLLLLL